MKLPTETYRNQSTRTIQRGFTLTELLLAVLVLLVVLLGLGRVFSTATQVTGIGQATANMMQEAAVIERLMRDDISRLSPEGVFAIRQVAVRNNVHGDRLLNPALPPDAIVRADQLVFFSDGVRSFQNPRLNEALNLFAQSAAARIYWGHAVQLPQGAPFEFVGTGSTIGDAHDPGNSPGQEPLVPWRAGPMDMVRTRFKPVDGAPVFSRQAGDTIDGTQPPANRWLLARQAVLLADDDLEPHDSNAKTVLYGTFGVSGSAITTARSVFTDTAFGTDTTHPRFGLSREVRNGRVDGAASTLRDIREWIRVNPDPANNELRFWDVQRDIISEQLVYYPRAERVPPSMNRVDQALSNHVVGSAVSSFIVEWTWNSGVGEVRNPDGSIAWTGFQTNAFNPNTNALYEYQPEQPWFGLNRSDFCPECPDRGVGFYGDVPFNDTSYPDSYQVLANYRPARTMFPNLDSTGTNPPNTIERWGDGNAYDEPFNWYGNDIRVYEAIFGYNRNAPLAYNTDSGEIKPFPNLGYTPWPSAIRVTMVLHDPQGRLEQGREVQFVIELPKRVR